MFCPSCGNEVNDDVKFCPSCGALLTPEAAPASETPAAEPSAPVTRAVPEPETVPAAKTIPEAATAEIPEQPAEPAPPVQAEAPAKPKKSKKPLIIAAAAVIVVVAGIFIARAVINNMHEKDYQKARQALAAEDYKTAKSRFEDLGDFRDSKEQAKYCDNSIAYNDALDLIDQDKYEDAQKVFEDLGKFKDSGQKAELCGNLIEYVKAEDLFSQKKYAEAKAIYDTLPDDTENYPSAAEHKKYCENKAAYNAASEKLKAKKYYEAYKAFTALGSFEDAAAKAQSCTQTFPSTGQTYHNPKFGSGVSLTIVPPSNNQYNYLKIYSGSELVSCVALGKNQRSTVSLPAGTYTIKDAYGSGPWFGGTDMFGDSGTYVKLTNGSSDTFTLSANMIYTLTLRSGNTNGGTSVGSKTENRGSF